MKIHIILNPCSIDWQPRARTSPRRALRLPGPFPPPTEAAAPPDGSVPLAVTPRCQTVITGSHSDWPQVTHPPSQYSGQGTLPVALIWVFVLFSSFLPPNPPVNPLMAGARSSVLAGSPDATLPEQGSPLEGYHPPWAC